MNVQGLTRLGVLSALLVGCSVTPPNAPESRLTLAAQQAGVKDAKLTPLADGGVALTGQLGPNVFAARIPPNWNGEAVLYAHGYHPPAQFAKDPLPPAETDQMAMGGDAPLLKNIYKQGYLVANSTYAKTGYAVKEGTEATLALRQLLSKAGVQKAYAFGSSMGGMVVVALMEKYPDAFVGSLATCGMVAGGRYEIGFLSDVAVIYEYYTRGTPYALLGLTDMAQPDLALTIERLSASVGGLFAAAAKGDAGAQRLIAEVSKVTGIAANAPSFLVPLTMALPAARADLIATQGGNSYTNVGRRYVGSSDDDALNAGVARIDNSAAALKYIDENYTPTGQLRSKLLSLQNTIDPLVPYSHQAAYAQIVQRAGFAQNLVRQTVAPLAPNPADPLKGGPTHCYFTDAQRLTAWNEVRDWVDRGVRPTDGADLTGVR